MSWLVIHDTEEAQFFRMDRPQKEAAENVREGSMPLPIYLPLHPEARLSEKEKTLLADGLQRTLGGELEGQGEGRAEDETDEN